LEEVEEDEEETVKRTGGPWETLTQS